MRLLALGVLLTSFGCASSRAARVASLEGKGDPAHPLFVGHSDTGDVVVAASHFDAMSGIAVAATDVGQKSGENLVCSREILTGTHVPTWICRYPKEQDSVRTATQNALVAPGACTPGNGSCGSH